jgi:hypothetical protein
MPENHLMLKAKSSVVTILAKFNLRFLMKTAPFGSGFCHFLSILDLLIAY